MKREDKQAYCVRWILSSLLISFAFKLAAGILHSIHLLPSSGEERLSKATFVMVVQGYIHRIILIMME